MKKGRTEDYAIWRACERFKILPPNILPKWEDMTSFSHALLISYDQIRQVEEAETLEIYGLR